MDVTITRVTPTYPRGVFVQWTVDDPNNTLASFEVLRSGSPSGPFEAVSGILADDNYSFTDNKLVLLGISNRAWYRVKAIPVSGGANAVLSEARTSDYDLDPVRGRLARKARHDLSVTLQRLNGVELAVLKRKRFGQRCSNCYNEATKDVVLSQCNECFGTSFSEGYHTPIRTWGKFDPNLVTETFGISGEAERAIQGLTIQEYPLVEIGDIIVEIRDNRRYIVKKKIQTESSRVVVHQDLQISELSRSAVEYRIRVLLS